MPRLRVLAGPSTSELVPISANSGVPLKIKSDAFEGSVVVYIKGFVDEAGRVGDSPYFEQDEREGITWSIQVQGRFLQRHSADDILFGNTFERPLKLPWGFSTALKFMNFIDPTLEQDLASKSKPWALSPLVATMPHLMHSRMDTGGRLPRFPPAKPIGDDISQLLPGEKRKSAFLKPARRKKVMFGPEDIITADFCYDYLVFSPSGIDLRLPGGLSFDMMKYWDGQPVRFVCCERVEKGELVDGLPWGRVFWCVAIENAEEDESEKSTVIFYGNK